MPKVILSIFKRRVIIGDEYRALIKIGEHAEPTANGRVIYQDGEEVEDDPMESKSLIRDPIRQMKEKAKKWAREQVDENGDPIIPFVHNLDFNPYE